MVIAGAKKVKRSPIFSHFSAKIVRQRSVENYNAAVGSSPCSMAAYIKTREFIGKEREGDGGRRESIEIACTELSDR